MKRIRYYIFVIINLLLAYGNTHAQQLNIDSLQQVVANGSVYDKMAASQKLASYYRNSNPSLSIEYHKKAIEFATGINDVGVLASSYQSLGSTYFRNGQYELAKENYTLALTKFTQTTNNKGVADVTAALGSVYYNQGNLPQASEYYLKSLRYYEEVNDKTGMVSMLSALSSIYARQNNFSKSIEYSLKAIKLYEESSDKFRALVGYDNIGNIYLRQEDPAKARVYFSKALALYTEMRNKPGIASTLLQLGNVEQLSGNHAAAILNYQKSLRLCEDLNIKPLQISNNIALGKSYMAQQNFEASIASYNKAIRISRQIKSNIELEEAYQGLARVYELTKQNEKAQTFNSLSDQLKDSLYNDSSLKKLTDQVLMYESEKKQQQIELLNKEQLIRESELNRQKDTANILWMASVVLGVLFLILIGFSLQNRRIAKNLRKQQAELIEKNRSIMEQKEKLDQLNNVKDRFFSIISHDLRNNLTTMKLYFDLISHKDYQPQDHSEVTTQIASSVENTIDLLENLLVWASAQIKGVPIHQQKLNMHTLAQENISLLNGVAHQKNITLENQVDENITAFADIDMINLVLRNLISNAIKFTPNNGLIKVCASMSERECTVRVEDNGIGIGIDMLQKLFNQYEHPTTKGTANEKGTGLGLMLCKDFVERNDGSIWAESEKGKGTIFYFSLPRQ